MSRVLFAAAGDAEAKTSCTLTVPLLDVAAEADVVLLPPTAEVEVILLLEAPPQLVSNPDNKRKRTAAHRFCI
jgi:hypothetical protein